MQHPISLDNFSYSISQLVQNIAPEKTYKEMPNFPVDEPFESVEQHTLHLTSEIETHLMVGIFYSFI